MFIGSLVVFSGGLFACSAPPTSIPATPSTSKATPAKAGEPTKQAPSPAAAKPTSPPEPAATQAPAKPRTLTKVRLGQISGTIRSAFTEMGVEKGIYRDEGVDVEFVAVQDGGAQLRGILSGEFDTGEMGPAAMFAAVEQGAPLKLVASHKPGLNFVMYTQKQIEQPEDLQGKQIGTAAPGQFVHQLVVAYFNLKNLDLSKVEFVNIGSSPNIFKAVVAGKVDAGPSGNDFIPTADKEPNIHVLFSFSDALPLWIQTALPAKEKDIADRPEMLIQTMMGLSKSIRYGLDHQDEFIKFAVEKFAKAPEEAAFGHKWERESHAMNPDLLFSREQVDFLQRINLDAGQQKQVFPFERVATLELAEKALARLGRYQWR